MSIGILMVIILAPITLILIGVVFILTRKNISQHRRKTRAEEITQKINKHRLSKVEAVLQRVHIIVKGNDEFMDLFKELERYHGKLETYVKRVMSDSSDLIANYKILHKAEYEEIYNRILDNILIIESTEKSFEVVSKQIIQQEEFLNNEHLFFAKMFREAVDVYRVKRIQLNKISGKIDSLSEKISDLSSDFKENLSIARNREASISLRKYAAHVRRFVKVISEAPQIESYIYSTIPEIVNKLTTEYKVKKKILNSQLGHINFRNSLIKISAQFNKAKTLYKSLKMEDVKILIRKILKSVKMLERMINYEITARNFFIENYETVIAETKTTLQRFVSIKKQINHMIQMGKVIPADLTTQVNDAKLISVEVDNKAIAFRNTMKTKDIPYSTKVSRMRSLLQKNAQLTQIMNEILQHIWGINIESSIIKNKFKKSEASINEILANLNKQGVHLTPEQKIQYEDISNLLNKLSQAIEQRIFNKNIRDEVDRLMEKSAIFYKIVGGNIRIAEIITSLIKELAPERAADAKLNVALNNSERLYLEGKYAESLNIIIRELEQKGE